MSILGWATSSQQRAVENARVAAVECSRRRVERAEVDEVLAELTASYAVPTAFRGSEVRTHEVSRSANAR